MNKSLRALAPLIVGPEKRIPADKEALEHLDVFMRTYDAFTQPWETLKGRWPLLTWEEAKRISYVWLRENHVRK